MEEDSEDVRVLEQADPALQESLQSENVPGEMEGEQTWPTEEEMEEAEGQLMGGLTDFLMSIRHFYSSNTMNKDNSKFTAISNSYSYPGKVPVQPS